MAGELQLPPNPTSDQLAVLAEYLKQQQNAASKETGYGSKNHYQDRKEILGKKLIIYRHSQKKTGVWYMRFYCGAKKYKVLSLRTEDKNKAIERALEKWRSLQNHMDVGGKVFETTTQDTIDEYLDHLKKLVETDQLKKHTVQGKRTSIKKLRLFLENYQKPSDIPPNVLRDYVFWRRTKNWDKTKHKNNPDPPADETINKELTDFKGFFDWCFSRKKFGKSIEYPFLKIDWKKSVEKNPAFEIDDWKAIVYYLRTWVRKTTNPNGNQRKNLLYRQVFSEYLKILANSGLRTHEALLLKWSDITLKKKVEVSKEGKSRERIIAHIEVSPETKTGRRLVICPAGIYFKRLREIYKEKEGRPPKPNDFIFRNVGTVSSRADSFIGKPLSSEFLRKLWYELLEDMKIDKGMVFDQRYTVYSCRSFFINQRLEMGVPPAIVAELVGHSIKTMERHYKNIRLKNLEPSLVEVRRKQLSEADFQTYDLD